MINNMHKKNIKTAGKSLQEADKVLIMIHGRGADARDILSVASHLNVQEYALLAPEATNNTWYPYSFMAPSEQNEPWLSSALDLVKEAVDTAREQGVPPWCLQTSCLICVIHRGVYKLHASFASSTMVFTNFAP